MAGEQRFTKPGSSRVDLDAAWRDRLTDAQSLLASGRYGAAIASGVYALEIRLKVLICKRLDLEELPRAFEIHDLDALLLLAGLSRRLHRPRAAQVKDNWMEVLSLAEKVNEIRYTGGGKWTQADADHLLQQLEDSSEGVLSWLSKQR